MRVKPVCEAGIGTCVDYWDAGARGEVGQRTPFPQRAGYGGKSAHLMLSTDLIFSHFLLTFILLSASISFYSQDFMTCHEVGSIYL